MLTEEPAFVGCLNTFRSYGAKLVGIPMEQDGMNINALDEALKAAKNRSELSLIEVKCSIGAREDLGRPTTTALENKENFMAYLKELKG